MTEFSYAVGNACVGAKAAARTIVANCDQNGVADAISDFVANHLHELRGEEDGVA